MDDEVYALLTRLIALAPDGHGALNALVRNTCAAALSLPPLIAEGESADDPMLAAFAEQFAVDATQITREQNDAMSADLRRGGIINFVQALQVVSFHGSAGSSAAAAASSARSSITGSIASRQT